MKILVTLLLMLVASYSNAAPSAVIYPNNWQFTRNNLTLEPMATKANSGTRTFFSGGSLHSPMDSSALKNVMGASAAEAIGTAITMKAPVVQSLARKAAIGAVLGGLAGAAIFLAPMGLEYLAGQFHQQTLAVPSQFAGFTSAGQGPGPLGAQTNFYYRNSIGTLPSGMGPYETGAISTCNGVSLPAGFYGVCGYAYAAPSIQNTPITQAAAESIAQASPITLTDADLKMMFDAGWGVPVSNPQVKIAPSPLNNGTINFVNFAAMNSAVQRATEIAKSSPTVVETVLPDGTVTFNYFPSPNARTNPVTGQQTLEAINIQPAPNGGVRLTPTEYPITSTGELVVPQGQTNPVPQNPQNTDPCELNPDRVGCASLGEPDSTSTTPTARTVEASFNEFNIAGQCPADKTFTVAGMTQTIQMAPICGAAQDYIRPFLLLMASVTAYFIFVGGLRT